MTSFTQYPCRFKSSRPGTYHNCFLPGVSTPWNLMGQGLLTTGCRIMDAECLPTLINSVQTIGSADTGSNFGLSALFDFVDDMGVCNMRTGHTDHV